MDKEKVGIFIQKLRKEKKLSQLELSEQLYVTQQAISNWEKGKTCPDIDCIKRLADFFNVDMQEIYNGARIKDKTKKNDIFYDIVIKEKSKVTKLFLIFITSIFIFIFLFLGYYFFNSYKSTKVFLITSDDEKIDVNGLMISTKDKIYFQINANNLEVKKMSLYFKNKEIYSIDDNSIKFKDFYGYDSYLSNKDIREIDDNLTLIIIDTSNQSHVINLLITKDYENDKLFLERKKEVGKPIDENYDKKKDNLEKLKDFIYQDGWYRLELNDKEVQVFLLYSEETNVVYVEEYKTDEIRKWEYSLDDSKVYCEVFDKNENFLFDFDSSNSEYIEIINDFKEKYIYQYFK